MRAHFRLIGLAMLCLASAAGTQPLAAADTDASAPAPEATPDPSGTIAHALRTTRLGGRTVHRLLDTNHDGQLSPGEAESFLQEHADGVFQLCDRNDDGVLSMAELRRAQPDPRVRLTTEIDPQLAAALGVDAAGQGDRGYQAVLTVGRQRAYIRDYDVGPGGNLDPQIGVLTTGTQLAIRRIVISYR